MKSIQWNYKKPINRIISQLQRGKILDLYEYYNDHCFIALNDKNVSTISKGGRARCKVENEIFNILKNQGYQFEHSFGHGNKNLNVIFAYLMLTAFLIDQIPRI